MNKQDKVTVFFDGHCRVCVRAKNFSEKLSTSQFISFKDLWEVKDSIKEINIQKRDLIKEIHLITERKQVYKGYNAIKYIILRIPFLMPLKLILQLPFGDNLGNFIYKVISKNRICVTNCNKCLI